MATANWPGSSGLGALATRNDPTSRRVQLPFSTVQSETDAPELIWGTGTPEAAVTAAIGDMFFRTDGGAGTTVYVKESGAGTNTGWVAK